MNTLTIQISEDELAQVIQAYRTLQAFLEKFVSPNELYHQTFVKGLKESLNDVKEGNYQEVSSFAEFIE